MDLIGWVPAVLRVESRPGASSSTAKLELLATLRCLTCGKVKEFTSHSFDLKAPSRAGAQASDALSKWRGFGESTAAAAAVQLAQTRNCEVCGSLSVVPPKQVERLKTEIIRTLTTDWLDAHATMNWRSYEESTRAAEEARKQFREGLKATYGLEDTSVARDLRAELTAAQAKVEQLERQAATAVTAASNGSTNGSAKGTRAKRATLKA